MAAVYSTWAVEVGRGPWLPYPDEIPDLRRRHGIWQPHQLQTALIIAVLRGSAAAFGQPFLGPRPRQRRSALQIDKQVNPSPKVEI